MPDHTPELPWHTDDFPSSPEQPGTSNNAEQIAHAAARCFRGADGAALLAYLHAATTGRALGPDAPDTALRHLEGQRHLVRHLCHMIDLGRAGPDTSVHPKGASE